ncbi:unnamed protein product [Lactuca saligna]|uniref:Uncharacterized protein n=1 Tax=Lactuca saligna TaxID=75948 RepID=A0AA35YAP2_LACSI|nr:unnamed protein product [Lactuca saligna]
MPFFQDNIAIASFAAIQKGIFVSCATGNSGPFNGTATNIAPWVLTIGASTTDRKIKATKKLGNNKEFDGESLFQPKGSPSSTLLPLVYAVKFNEYASVVVSAGYDRSLRAWDCRSHSIEPIRIIDTFLDSVMSICLTKTEIIAGSVDGTVRTFDIRIDGTFERSRKRGITVFSDYAWSSGDQVDVWVQDSWHEAIVMDTNKIDLTSLTVQFPAVKELIAVATNREDSKSVVELTNGSSEDTKEQILQRIFFVLFCRGYPSHFPKLPLPLQCFFFVSVYFVHQVKLVEERNMKPLDSNLAALVLKNYERQDATLLSRNLM